MSNSNSSTPKVLRLKSVKEITGLSRSSIYAAIKAGRFPKQVHLTSNRCVGWISDEISSYIQTCANARTSVNVEGI